MSVTQAIADWLNEAARYARRDPETARSMISQVVVEMRQRNRAPERLVGNLEAAQKWVVVEPDVAAGYCRGAAFELQAAAAKGGES